MPYTPKDDNVWALVCSHIVCGARIQGNTNHSSWMNVLMVSPSICVLVCPILIVWCNPHGIVDHICGAHPLLFRVLWQRVPRLDIG